MQHAGLQYGQGAANSHQSPPFGHADISQTNGGNTTSSLRQFRKKDGADKNSSTDLNTSVESSHIARVPPHNHYPARPNDYYRYQHQYPDYSLPYKETPAQVKYSEIAETPPQSIQHVDHIPAALQKHKEVHKDFMDMCNISQQTHMKQNYPDNLTRQQSYPPDAASVHHQYLHKEPQVHPGYKPESQYQQYPQIPKYNMPSQCRKYPPPPPENDFLAKLQRINPSMARSIMSDHHIRESQTTYPSMDQNRMYSQNQRYYPPAHLQNNVSYNYQPYNYPSSCNYKHPDYPRSNQMGASATQYPSLNPHTERSISPRNIHMMNYTSPQKISPNYSQYNPPEYAQHYQHRRTSLPQDYYQQTCRTNPYMAGHQISPESADNRGAGGGLRHFIENWAEEEGTAEITPIFKENIRIHNNESSNNEQVFVINSSDIPQCLENVSLVPTENGQFIIKSGALDNSVVRIKETTETNGERTVNVQIVEAPQKPDCMLAEEPEKTTPEASPKVPYQENQNEKVCDEITKPSQPVEEQKETEKETTQHSEEVQEKNDECSAETSVIVSNEVSVIKDMPLIDEEHAKNEKEHPRTEEEHAKSEEEETQNNAETVPDAPCDETTDDKDETANQEENEEDKEVPEESVLTSATKRTQRIFSVDDIINNIGSSPTETRRSSLQFVPKGIDEEAAEECATSDKVDDEESVAGEMEYRNAISVDDDNVILEIGGAWVQLNINYRNGTKVLRVLPLSESLVIDVNGNYQDSGETGLITEESCQNSETTNKYIQDTDTPKEHQSNELIDKLEDEDTEQHKNVEPAEETAPKTELFESNSQNSAASEEKLHKEISAEKLETDEHLEEISSSVCQSEIVIGEEILDNEVFLDLTCETTTKNTLLEEGIKNSAVVEDDTKNSTVVEEDTKNSAVCKEDANNYAETKEEDASNCKVVDISRRRDDKRKSRDGEERRRSSSKKIRSEERKDIEERSKVKKSQKSEDSESKTARKNKTDSPKVGTEPKRDTSEESKKKDTSSSKKIDKKLTSQTSTNEEDVKKKEKQGEVLRAKKQEKKLTPQSSIEENDGKLKDKQEEVSKSKKLERRITSQVSINSEEEKKYISESASKIKKQEKKLTLIIKTKEEHHETSKQKVTQEECIKSVKKEKKLTSASTGDDRPTKEKETSDETKLVRKDKKMPTLENVEDESNNKGIQESVKPVNSEETELINALENEDLEPRETKSYEKLFKEKKSTPQPVVDDHKQKPTVPQQAGPAGEEIKDQQDGVKRLENRKDDKQEETTVQSIESQQIVKEQTPSNSADVVRLAEEMIAKKQLEETKETEKLPTKAAKKLYVSDSPLGTNVIKETRTKNEETVKAKKSISKLEETVNKIKSLKEKVDKHDGRTKKTSLKDSSERKTKIPKKVTFNLETDVREISKEEIDRKRLSLEEYNNRKRKTPTIIDPGETRNKIMEDTVTSTGDVSDEGVEQVELFIENSIKDTQLKKSPPKMAPSNWEDDTSSPKSPIKDEVMSTTNRKCIIDVNEFNIKPIESVSTPSPVSSSQFSYHSEDDSLQVYKDVVDSKLNSLNIKIPKLSKPKPVDRLTILLDRFLNKGSLNCEELEEVKKFIEIKRKMLEEEKKLTYEVRGERGYKDLKLHFRKVPEKRKKKRFRNLYAEDSSEESDSSRSEKGVGDYSVYQRDSQGVPKLIFKRKSGLPQPFVKLERSQAVELLAKKRKLY